MNRRGSVMMHVLVTGVVVALIAASLLQLSMMRLTVTNNAAKGGQAKRSDEAALARLMTAWNAVNGKCDSPTSAYGYACAPAGANCSCTCAPTLAGDPTVNVSGPAAGPCRFDIVSIDPP
jgi:Tfp pilus assembly protein PilX